MRTHEVIEALRDISDDDSDVVENDRDFLRWSDDSDYNPEFESDSDLSYDDSDDDDYEDYESSIIICGHFSAVAAFRNRSLQNLDICYNWLPYWTIFCDWFKTLEVVKVG